MNILEKLKEGIKVQGAVFLFSKKGEMLMHETFGQAYVHDEFPVGNLRWVLATLPAVLKTIEKGKLSLSEPVWKHVYEVVTGVDPYRKSQITIYHLLNHTSGFPDVLEGEFLGMLEKTELMSQPGETKKWSHVGYKLLELILEKVWNMPFEEIVKKEVFEKLEMYNAYFKEGKLYISSASILRYLEMWQQNGYAPKGGRFLNTALIAIAKSAELGWEREVVQKFLGSEIEAEKEVFEDSYGFLADNGSLLVLTPKDRANFIFLTNPITNLEIVEENEI